MLVRLLLALLLAAFASPMMAAAPCHDGAAMAGMAMPGRTPAGPDTRHEAVPVHACIGCVPPSTWRSGITGRRLMPASPVPAPRIARLDLGPAAPPALPPPRREG